MTIRRYWLEWRERLLDYASTCDPAKASQFKGVECSAERQLERESNIAWYAGHRGALMFIPEKRLGFIMRHAGSITETMLYSFFSRDGRLLASVVGECEAMKWAVHEAERQTLLAAVSSRPSAAPARRRTL